IWRKLKRLGATLIHDAVWVLPRTPETLEQFQLLADEICEFGGNALLWEANLAIDEQNETLVQALQ
ncbi:MAG TPA: Chromate resistance protein ChrB, partial [Ktedonobacteraceae bacterium]|nr:Chromate resistance protein ChrB [Ktedonobacteraceae bacterium]